MDVPDAAAVVAVDVADTVGAGAEAGGGGGGGRDEAGANDADWPSKDRILGLIGAT